MEPDLKELEAVLRLMAKYQLDSIRLPTGLTITKSLHSVLPGKKLKSSKDPTSEIVHPNDLPVNYLPDDEEVIFASSSAPQIDLPDWSRTYTEPLVEEPVEDS